MHSHMGLRAITAPEQFFHLRGFGVGFTQGNISIHQDVHLYGVVVAYTTCPQVVGLHNSWQGCHQLQDLVFNSIRQRLLHQVTYTTTQQVNGNLYDKGTHND